MVALQAAPRCFHAIGISLVWVSFADPETLTSIPLKR